ncbi:MAG: undecaprenyl-diphosphate phosphatase [Granulosicoccaceae bacterium]|jgi:undecaprenyl-diphosphatase
MTLLQIITLALMQGLTEFLPISSSAHLILVPVLTGWQDQGLAFDVAVHVGTLSAVVLYFRRDVLRLMHDGMLSVLQRRQVGDSRLAWAVVIGTIPAGLAGVLGHDFIATQMRTPLVIAGATIGFGLLLGLSDWLGQRQRDERSLGMIDVLLIGLAQALALVPGTSRSGITMTAGLLLGLTRQAAARFSFLLSIPIILASGGLETWKLASGAAPVDWNALFMGVLISGVSAFTCIHFFLKWLDRVGMWPFVWYRLALGIGLLVLFY